MSSPEEVIQILIKKKGWPELNKIQQIAVEQGLLANRTNYVVIAPTASGKTGIAELAMLQALKEGRKVVYLVPSSSLINDKKVEFEYYKPEYSLHPDAEDKVEFKDADIVLMTFENFYKQSLLRPDILSKFGLIIIDEFQVLYDQLRGFNLEKVLTMIKIFKTRIICLSATFENKESIAEWLGASIISIPSELRPIPLKHSYIDLTEIPSQTQIKSLYSELETRKLYPALIFCYKRQDTQSRANKFSEESKVTINSKVTITKEVEEVLDRSTLTEEESALISCIEKGVAFHHSGIRQDLRNYIESLFRERKLKYLFSTTGLAYGVNFPAKCVVLYDIDFYNLTTNRNEKVPVYVYLQMAGRAGRPQFGSEGYSYVVAKDKDQLEKRVPEYLDGKIEDAISQIGNDDFFQKTILELIFTGRNKDSDILSFFDGTYYNFLNQKVVNALVPFNLFSIVQRQAQQLSDYGFIVTQGAAGYKLTDLGYVTVDFLFSTYHPYKLTPFVMLDRHISETGKVQYDFEFMYKMFQIFSDIATSRIARKHSEIIYKFYRKRGKRKEEIGSAEYSAYATFYGWIENVDEVQIEEKYMVNAHPIATNARELSNLLEVYKKLAEKRLINVPPEFDIFSARIHYGVTEEELPIINIHGIGRETSRSIRDYCNNVLKKGQGYQGSIIDILCSLYKKVGERDFIDIHVQYIHGVGRKRAESIASLIKEKLS